MVFVVTGCPGDQVLWYRQRDSTIRLSYQATNGFSMQSKLLTPNCSLGEIGDTSPLRGDFDGDGELEIFWVAYESGQHVLWRDTFSLWSDGNNGKCADTDIVKRIAPNGFQQVVSKPFVADFDGDGADDIFWLAPPDGNTNDKVWLRVGLDDGPLIVDPIIDGAQRPAGDRTPFTGDYNGDACDDILWYSPDSEFRVLTDSGATIESVSGTTPLWQSSCSHDDSVINFQFSTITPPMEATPVGFDPRSSVRTH